MLTTLAKVLNWSMRLEKSSYDFRIVADKTLSSLVRHSEIYVRLMLSPKFSFFFVYFLVELYLEIKEFLLFFS